MSKYPPFYISYFTNLSINLQSVAFEPGWQT